jgi:hypothetical protein
MKKKLDEPDFARQIKVIMNEFDFHRVHAAMVAMDWKWYTTSFDGKVPNLSEIKACLLRYLSAAADQYDGDYRLVASGSGGFHVSMNEYNELTAYFGIESGHYVSPEGGDRDYFGIR